MVMNCLSQFNSIYSYSANSRQKSSFSIFWLTEGYIVLHCLLIQTTAHLFQDHSAMVV